MSALGSRRRTTALCVLCGAVLIAAMAAVTAIVVREHRARAAATAEALFHEDLRTAMWRMETRVGTMIATTTNRTSDANAWIDPRSNVVNGAGPSAFRNEPELNDEVVAAADTAFLYACELESAGAGASLSSGPQAFERGPELPRESIAERGATRSQQEFQRRVESNQLLGLSTANRVEGEAFATCVGPLAPVWSEGRDGLDLYLARRVEAPDGVRHESYRVEWAALRETLLGEIEDLFPGADLVPIAPGGGDRDDAASPTRAYDPARPEPSEDDAVRLASLPARLVVDAPDVTLALSRALLLSLGGAWTALLVALGFGAIALRASFAYGEKHRRFTHAVTHELRTPLTTFRMYSEMLSRGMVPESARAEYLATLEAESTRLAGLVENVLRYARLEERRSAPALERMTTSELLDRCTPELARICAQARAALHAEGANDGDAVVQTDAGAVHQILTNLVENACKYGCAEGGERRITLRARADARCVQIDVEDEGPGVDPSLQRAIFEPFERAGRDAADPAPGVGLGLALARGLARELGGDLELVPSPRGARFRLSLPR